MALTIPSTPWFAPNSVATVTQLNNLSAMVQAACQSEVFWHVHSTATQAISANTNTTITQGTAIYDPAGTLTSSTTTTIPVSGYYAVEAQIAFTEPTSADVFEVWCYYNGGASNIEWHEQMSTGGPSSNSWRFQTVIPARLAAGTTLYWAIEAPEALTLSNTALQTGGSDYAGAADGGCHFYGRWLGMS